MYYFEEFSLSFYKLKVCLKEMTKVVESRLNNHKVGYGVLSAFQLISREQISCPEGKRGSEG